MLHRLAAGSISLRAGGAKYLAASKEAQRDGDGERRPKVVISREREAETC